MKHYRSPQPELFVAVRKQLGYLQPLMAHALNTNKSTISRIERGLQCPDMDLIRRLLNLWEEASVRKQLAPLPVVEAIKSRLAQPLTLAGLSDWELDELRSIHQEKIREQHKRLAFLRQKLNVAVVHSTLDGMTLDSMNRRARLMRFAEEQAVGMNRDSDLQADLRQQAKSSAQVLESRKRKAVVLPAVVEMELRQEIQLLEQQVENRKALVEEIRALMAEREFRAVVPTEESLAALQPAGKEPCVADTEGDDNAGACADDPPEELSEELHGRDGRNRSGELVACDLGAQPGDGRRLQGAMAVTVGGELVADSRASLLSGAMGEP